MDDIRFLAALAVASIGVVASLIGIALASGFRRSAKMFGAVALAFSAGMLSCIVFFHTVPIAVRADGVIWVLAGLLASFWLIRAVAKHTTTRQEIAGEIFSALALGLHSLIDGAMYTITFVSRGVSDGFVSALGLTAHELPEGVLVYLLLEHAGVSRKKAALAGFMLVGLTTPLGVIITYPLMTAAFADQSILNAMFGFIAGLMVTAVCGILPRAIRDAPAVLSIPALGSGAFAAVLVLTAHAHG